MWILPVCLTSASKNPRYSSNSWKAHKVSESGPRPRQTFWNAGNLGRIPIIPFLGFCEPPCNFHASKPGTQDRLSVSTPGSDHILSCRHLERRFPHFYFGRKTARASSGFSSSWAWWFSASCFSAKRRHTTPSSRWYLPVQNSVWESYPGSVSESK